VAEKRLFPSNHDDDHQNIDMIHSSNGNTSSTLVLLTSPLKSYSENIEYEKEKDLHLVDR